MANENKGQQKLLLPPTLACQLLLVKSAALNCRSPFRGRGLRYHYIGNQISPHCQVAVKPWHNASHTTFLPCCMAGTVLPQGCSKLIAEAIAGRLHAGRLQFDRRYDRRNGASHPARIMIFWEHSACQWTPVCCHWAGTAASPRLIYPDPALLPSTQENRVPIFRPISAVSHGHRGRHRHRRSRSPFGAPAIGD